MVSRGNVFTARSGHSTRRTAAPSTSSSHPSISSSASERSRYRSACTTGPRGASYCWIIEKVGLVTASIAVTPIPTQIARTNVVLPAPRSPSSAITTGRGSTAPSARPHASSESRSGARGAPRPNKYESESTATLAPGAPHRRTARRSLRGGRVATRLLRFFAECRTHFE